MSSEEPTNSSDSNYDQVIKNLDTSINGLQNMLDWILTTRENVANMNLELHTLFKPMEAFLEEIGNIPEDFPKTKCPLHENCQKITSNVASNLRKIPDDTEQ